MKFTSTLALGLSVVVDGTLGAKIPQGPKVRNLLHVCLFFCLTTLVYTDDMSARC